MSHLRIDLLANSLDVENFNEVVFLSTLFPDEEDLSFIDEDLEWIQNETALIDEEVTRAVCKCSSEGDQSREIISSVWNSIDFLEKSLTTLDTEASETECVINEVCGGIRHFDKAKTNLMSTITTYQRLQMAQKTIDELEVLVQLQSFGEAAPRLLALRSLMEFFENYEPSAILSEIQLRFEKVLRDTKSILICTFSNSLFEAVVDPSLRDACYMVDAIGSSFRESIVEMFCDRFIEPYTQRFTTTPLEEIERRYNWLKQSIDLYNIDFAKVFPDEWKVKYALSRYFCVITRQHIEAILRTKPSQKEFQFGFEKTALFEKMLTDTFSADFTGLIGVAFASYTDLYIQGEVKALRSFINGSLRNMQADKDIHLLKSATELVQRMNLSTEKAGAFTAGNALFELFFKLKDAISYYCEGIHQRMPQKMQTDAEICGMAVIVNSNFYFCSIVDGLATRISKKVAEDQKDKIKINDLKNRLSDLVVEELQIYSDGICERLRTEFDSLASGSWQADPKTPGWLTPMQKKLHKVLNVTRNWMSPENLSALLIQFTPRFVDVFFQNAFHTTPLTPHGVELISSSSESIQKTLKREFVRKEDKLADIRHKWIEERFALINNSLTVLLSNDEAMAIVYIGISKEPSKERFETLLRVKEGLAPDVRSRLLEAYDQEYARRSN